MAVSEMLNFINNTVGAAITTATMQLQFVNNTIMKNEFTTMSTTEIPYESYELRPETYMVPIIFGFIFIVGVLGNGTLIIVFLRHRAMRNVPNT